MEPQISAAGMGWFPFGRHKGVIVTVAPGGFERTRRRAPEWRMATRDFEDSVLARHPPAD
jgi:hypothetical protein